MRGLQVLELWGGQSHFGILGRGRAGSLDGRACGLVHDSGCDGTVTTLTGRNFDASSLVTKGDSSEVMARIIELHFPDPNTFILDLTYGKGVFWKAIDQADFHRRVTTNDLDLATDAEWHSDFRNACFASSSYDIVVFDPPFTSSGEGQYNGYGTDRTVEGAPQNRKDIRELLAGGMREAMRIARSGIIVKAQVVVESGQTWNNPLIPELMLEASPEWYLDDIVYQHTAKRRQPPDRRVEHFQGKPSVWLIAKRYSKPRPNPELLNWLRELSGTISCP